MNSEMMKARTEQFSLRVIRLVESLPQTKTSNFIGNQLLRLGTSVGANYRAACRAKSTADLIHKLSIVEEEADESLYWMELLVASKIVKESQLLLLMSDMDEIISMVVSSIKTLRSKQTQNPKFKI